MLDQPPAPKIRNPHTHAQLRREVFWQITLPFALAVIVTFALVGLTISSANSPARSPLADVSVIFLIIPVAIWGIVFLALTAAACVGMIYALRELPPLFKQAQDFMVRVAAETNKYTTQAISGVYSVRSFAGSAQAVIAKIRAAFSFLG